MSIEGPEARILADQLVREVAGRRVTGCELHDVANLQRLGFVNQDLADFDAATGGLIDTVAARGNTIRVALDNGSNLVIAPEYGGRLLLHGSRAEVPAKTHLVVTLDDGRLLSVRLTGMGMLHCHTDAQLSQAYVYRRDFSATADPTGEPLPLAAFDRMVAARGQALKAVLVGRDAVVVGIANSAFQDILYRAGLHPKRKASQLPATERRRLHAALLEVVSERLRLGGKIGFVDLYGTPGRYEPAMGLNRQGATCGACGHAVESLAVGGGRICYCPGCQR